jgi:uncharacterized heparinase superfamily protein
VVASPVQDGEGVLLRLPSGHGWRLRAKGAKVAVEESVYLGGEARRTQQIVLQAEAGEDTIQWAINRVSAAMPGEPPPEG